jgi:hypothetical protein
MPSLTHGQNIALSIAIGALIGGIIGWFLFYRVRPEPKKESLSLSKLLRQSKPGEELDLSPFKSCTHSNEMATWHPGRVKHKLMCDEFWAFNPSRTAQELIKGEGFGNADPLSFIRDP